MLDDVRLAVGGRAPVEFYGRMGGVVPLLAPGGTLIYNAPFLVHPIARHDIRAVPIAGSEIAAELGNPKLLNMVMLGARRLFDWVHNNAMVELHPTDYVNDPFVIAQHRQTVAINSALQVDLTGQVCADSIGGADLQRAGRSISSAGRRARRVGGRSSRCRRRPSTARSQGEQQTIPADGVGKTTTVLNLAGFAGRMGEARAGDRHRSAGFAQPGCAA